MNEYPTWDTTNVQWQNANWTFSECQLVEEIVKTYSGVDASKFFEEPYSPWSRDKEKKKRLIKLICKIKGIEFSSEKEKLENIKISVEDIKLVVKTVSGVELSIKAK